MDYTRIDLVIEEGLARLTFNEPTRGNPIDSVLCAELCDVAAVLSEDPAVRCVLITAKGKVFSYGGDISTFVPDLPGLPLRIKRSTTTFHSAVARLQRMDAPIVVAVHGLCVGGMSGFVAGADIVVAAQDAAFVAAYAGIGFSADAGSTVMYTRRMGAARARRFLLLGETLDAQAALAAGLVDEVVAPEQLHDRAAAIATRLANGPTRAFGEMRRLFNSVHDQPLETQLELEAQALARCSATSDSREAILAFSQKRRPVFKGE